MHREGGGVWGGFLLLCIYSLFIDSFVCIWGILGGWWKTLGVFSHSPVSLFFLIYKDLFVLHLYMCVLTTCVSAHHACAWCQWRWEEVTDLILQPPSFSDRLSDLRAPKILLSLPPSLSHEVTVTWDYNLLLCECWGFELRSSYLHYKFSYPLSGLNSQSINSYRKSIFWSISFQPDWWQKNYSDHPEISSD